MTNTVSINLSVVQQWIANNLDEQKVKEELIALGYDEETIGSNLKEFKKLKYAKRRYSGFVYLFAGAFLGFISCVLTLLNTMPELYYWILYGLTSIALIIIFKGLYNLLEN